MTASPSPATDASEPLGARAGDTRPWYALLVLTAIMTLHHVDRNVVNVVVEPVKLEFGLSDAQMGAVTGLAHSLMLAVFVLPMGWLADRTNRIRLVSVAVIVWSGLTAIGALARGFWSLLLVRAGVGAAEAAGPPAAVSLLSDLFPPARRASAMGIYYLHVALGTGAVFLVGGWVAHAFGWRAVFLLAGAPGLLLGLLLWITVREPARRSAERPAATFSQAVVAAARNPGVLAVVGAGAAATVAQASLWAWLGSFFIRTHHLNLAQAGLALAVISGAAKGLGSLISGPGVHAFGGDRPERQWRYPAFVLAASVPLAWGMVLAPTLAGSLFWAVLLGVAVGGWPAPTMVILVGSTPAHLRATSVSGFHLCTSLIGTGLGPLFTGAVSDLMGGRDAIGMALASCLTVNLVAAAGLAVACRQHGGKHN